ncbi:hypothetical protein HF292_009835 [Acidithiobacillus ferruginosus]|jgi:hypothetical protein|uniref:Uncharacterized protein n=1 Tax=Acidithiobacillus ferruginosus TaxID=3063951 RepID=A0ACD5IEF0_9PROT|nr:hypothetical protein [Acidithiobacillus ferruginosus]MBU2814597.1 hypothetical protein [Acidithiobacillus ferruginosus]
MHDNLQDNQRFIDDAKMCGLDTLAYHDRKSHGFMLLAGHPESIRILGEILDDYETMWGMAEELMGTKGENEHA